jgi:hypothetical protein
MPITPARPSSASRTPPARRGCITLFGDPELFERFSLPAAMLATDAKHDITE